MKILLGEAKFLWAFSLSSQQEVMTSCWPNKEIVSKNPALQDIKIDKSILMVFTIPEKLMFFKNLWITTWEKKFEIDSREKDMNYYLRAKIEDR